MPKVKCICKQCGKEFEVYPSTIKQGRGIFCSQNCYNTWNRGENNHFWDGGKVERVCKVCGRIFFESTSRIKEERGKFCSRECYKKWQTSGKVKKICETCGKVFFVSPCRKVAARFCSHKCWGMWQSEHKKGKNNPNWKGGKIKRICPICGNVFEIIPSRAEKGKGNFCSVSCARQAQKMPTHHTKPEMIWQEIAIDKHSLPFKYTGDSSFWIGKNPAITPDFIHLTKKIAVEIFSYWHDPLKRHCKVPYSQTYEGRKKILKKYGWKMIVFWQDDLEQEDAEKYILRVLKEEKVI